MGNSNQCQNCQTVNEVGRYFCKECGHFLRPDLIDDPEIYASSELKTMRIIENLQHVPHSRILWNDMIDRYTGKVEKYAALMNLDEMKDEQEESTEQTMMDFLDLCNKPEFQIAFVGTIKTGKSTLINALLGHNYASMAVTPETAALTKFRSSPRDYVKVTFYSKNEWEKLWASRTSSADAFMEEYNRLQADRVKDQWVGHEEILKVMPNEDIEKELSVWSSSKSPEHYFVKEIEVGISSLAKDFPSQVVFVDTPGLSDPVAYRSEITKKYIRRANAVFVCVDASKLQKDEIETIASVFSYSSHNKNKVHIIATHWDKLNSPVKDWENQKSYLMDRLFGKGFFEQKEMAEKNIIHAAAYIYNLCRDFDTLDPNSDEYYSLMQFALGMRMDLRNMKENLKTMAKLSNIDNISDIIKTELAKNYEELLTQDIDKKYKDIKYTLKRVAKNSQAKVGDLINVSFKGMDELNKKVEEQEKNLKEIKDCEAQLEDLLEAMKKRTQKRLDQILPELDKACKNNRKKK